MNGSTTAADAAICTAASPSLGTQQARCGYGPRLPLLVISPFAKRGHIDHGVTDQSSILRFVEDNWDLGRIGGGSFDGIAGSLLPMFDFGGGGDRTLILDPASGEVVFSGDSD